MSTYLCLVYPPLEMSEVKEVPRLSSRQKIFLRLRPPSAEDTFYCHNRLIFVMLQEVHHASRDQFRGQTNFFNSSLLIMSTVPIARGSTRFHQCLGLNVMECA